ncbi:MAG: AraC family transcriptional regulator ligand-binding domain-containing protein [Granulosicoccus sp.]
MKPYKNPDITFVSASYARNLFIAVAKQGLDPSTILADESLNVESIENATQLDAAMFGRMYQRAIHLLNDESLGMVSGAAVVTGTFRMMCLCTIHRPCLATVVKRAGEFLDICLAAGVKPVLINDKARVCVGFATVERESRSIEEILASEHPVCVRSSLYLWHSLLSWFAGRNLPLQEVVFSFDPPSRLESWTGLFRCPVTFSGSRSMLCFEPGILDFPNVQSEQSLSVFLKSAPYRLIVPSYYEQTLSERVLALFGDDFSQSLPAASEVARQLGMSVSSLRRQLKDEGNSFQQLKDQCRRNAAAQYLASSELALSDVSALLGFDETSAFFRAFKRWTGKTPSEYRAGLSLD